MVYETDIGRVREGQRGRSGEPFDETDAPALPRLHRAHEHHPRELVDDEPDAGPGGRGAANMSSAAAGRSGQCAALVAALLLGLASDAATQEPESMPAVQPLEAGQLPRSPEVTTAAAILAAQPGDVLARLAEKKVVVVQEVVDEGALSGGLITAFVVFAEPVERTYRFLSQTGRQAEFRSELTGIETVEVTAHGTIDEHRLKILFRRYVYRLEYELDPAKRQIHWKLDERFGNDLRMLDGFWELYAMDDGRTLGRFGTSVDVGPAVPAFLQDWITRKNMPSTMERVRLWVDSGGTYRP
jgi:hypothetical protein